jgi:hypothetical protein
LSLKKYNFSQKFNFLFLLLAHLAKGNVSFCHHLASVESVNQKQETPVVAMYVNGSEQNVQSLERTFHR